MATCLNYVNFCYFNVADADPAAETGVSHQPKTHQIPLAFDTIEGNHDALTIFGTDCGTIDRTCTRDYV